MEQEIQKEVVKLLEDIRDQHYKIMESFRMGYVSNASYNLLTESVFSKLIDALDLTMFGNEPRKITDGVWSKWTR